ncbi:hypothetical protein [Desulfosoma caldarium]|nr:hypothetical protein [Desulfosoma caldarium]
MARHEAWQQFEAGYKARWTDSLERVWRARVLVIASLPDRLRLEILTGLGQVQGLFVFDGTRATLWIVPERVVYTSVRQGVLLEQLLGLRLPGTELAPTLLGLPSLDKLDGVVVRRLQDGTVVLDSGHGKPEPLRHIHLCEDQERLCCMDFSDAGAPLSVLFQYGAKGPDRDIPTSLTFHSATGMVELTRTFFRQPARVAPETFEVPLPEGDVQVVEVP